VKRRAVAGYLAGIIVDGNHESVPRVASRLGLEDQIVANDPERFKIGRAAFTFPLFLIPPLTRNAHNGSDQRASRPVSFSFFATTFWLGQTLK
jgi:hypothetical protein